MFDGEIRDRVDRLELPWNEFGVDPYGISKEHLAVFFGLLEPLYRHYQRLLDGGTKPNLAKLTIARQIAAISLALWRNQEDYDQSKFKQPT